MFSLTGIERNSFDTCLDTCRSWMKDLLVLKASVRSTQQGAGSKINVQLSSTSAYLFVAERLTHWRWLLQTPTLRNEVIHKLNAYSSDFTFEISSRIDGTTGWIGRESVLGFVGSQLFASGLSVVTRTWTFESQVLSNYKLKFFLSHVRVVD